MGSYWITGEERERIRKLKASGQSTTEVASATGRSPAAIDKIVAAAGGLPPRARSRGLRSLSLAEREEISRGLVEGLSFAEITRRLGRDHTSTVSREVEANGGRHRYRAWAADRRAAERARRPKPAKLVACPRLRAEVEGLLAERWSPQQVARRLRVEHPDDPGMHVSHETIYQSLYVQGRGALRKELAACLRSGRAHRRVRGRTGRGGGIPGLVSISERPAEVEDRAVPGHWEGDLVMGRANRSAIGTLVERSTRYLVLLHLPDGHTAEQVRDAMTAEILRLPSRLRRSLTWDRGTEMARHLEFTVATGVEVYFCDPRSPWQRGSNENTNGLLRQYFPKGTDLSVHTRADLDAAAHSLNNRPRQTLDWMKPSEKLAELVALTA